MASPAAHSRGAGDDAVSPRGTSATSEVIGGSARVFVAEAVSLPTALITAAFVARRFGPGDYGLYTLAIAIVAWLEWTLSSLFARATVKLVADADDWRPAGAVALRLFGATGALGFVAVWLAAGPIAALLHEPSLAHHLRVIAFDVPLFLLAQAHQQILVGTGAYAHRATVAAWRWVGRMVLVVAFVSAGLAVDGALLGIVGASVVELVVARALVRPRLRDARPGGHRAMWAFALPLFASAVCLRLFDKLDLFALKALGASAETAGIYGAAQNLTIVPALVALSVTTLLLSTLSRAIRLGDEAGARALVRNAMRGVVLMFPFAGVAAGASTELATSIFGAPFALTGAVLSVLIFGAIAVVMISVTSALLTAAGRPRWTMISAVPVLPLALVGHLLVIPRYGAMGAAAVTATAAAIGAVLALATVRRAWHLWPPASTVARSLVATTLTAAIGTWWTTAGAMVVVELAAMSLIAVVLLIAMGEVAAHERRAALSLLRRAPEIV